MATVATTPMSFEDKYKQQIGKLATYNKVDVGVGKDMLLSNLTAGGQYKGGGELDYGVAGQDANDYLARLKAASQNATKPAASIGGGSTAPQAPDYSGQINSIYDNQKASQLAQLKASQDKAIGQTNLEQQQALPQYQNMRNQTDVDKAQALQRIREGMANAGLFNSGDNVTGQISLENTRQNAINATDLQQQQFLNSLNQRRADILNPANEQSMIAALNAEQAKALMDAQYRSQDNAFRQQDFNYRQQRDTVGDQRYTEQTAYQHGRDSIADDRYKQEFDNNVKYQGLEFALKQAVSAHQMSSEDAQIAISQQNANTNSGQLGLEQSKFQYAKDNPKDMTKPPTKDNLGAMYMDNVGKMTPQDRANFFQQEKSSIVNDLGMGGYNQLYNMYYDQYGNPK